MTNRVTTWILALGICASLSACADLESDDEQLRSAAKVTLTVTTGGDNAAAGSGGDDGTVIWEILEAGVTEHSGGGDEGTVIWDIQEAGVTELRDPDTGTVVCEIDGSVLRDANSGSPVLELLGDYATLPGGSRVYEYDLEDVLEASRGTLLATASVDLQAASARDRLISAALLSGDCR